MLSVTEQASGLITMDASGSLDTADRRRFVAELSALAASGARRLLIRIGDLDGSEPDAAWEALALEPRNHRAFDRVAVTGDPRWEKWMMLLSGPFATAHVRYFTAEEADAALAWVRDDRARG
ncbi:MAG: STAS/SEC14 domain-containing protein [Pseudomonadota bacterium]